MDISLLAPFQSRWPHDRLPFDGNLSLQNISQTLNQLQDSSSPWDTLQIDAADSKVIADFAQANGMSYSARPDSSSPYATAQAPAWVGSSTPATAPVYVHEITGNLHGYKALFFLEYAPGAIQTRGDNHVKLRKRSIVRVKLPKTFPQVVLDSRRNEPGYVSSFPTTIKADQKITLEGDFNTFFDFYGPANVQVNILTLLAPNFMQILMDSASTFDVEFFGDEMILATWDCIYDPAVMKEALTALSVQLSYLDRLLTSWNYNPVQQPFDTLQYAYFNGETVKVGRLRLSPSQLLMIILGLMVLYGVAIVLTK